MSSFPVGGKWMCSHFAMCRLNRQVFLFPEMKVLFRVHIPPKSPRNSSSAQRFYDRCDSRAAASGSRPNIVITTLQVLLGEEVSVHCSLPALSPLQPCSRPAGPQKLPWKAVKATLTELLKLPRDCPVADLPSASKPHSTGRGKINAPCSATFEDGP